MKPVAIITGAASNIGLAIANRFITDYQVLGLDLKCQPEKTEESSDSFEHYRCDITNLSDLAAAIKHARKMGQISAVVHSAAITEPRATIRDISVDSWRRVIEVNLSATFFLMKLIAPDLEASRGAGVFIASRAGKAGYAGFDPTPLGTKAHYCASKAGVISLVKSFAIELAPFGVRINGVAPGSIEGEMIPKEKWPELSQRIPLGRLGKPAEVAEAAYFLCSSSSSYITGHILDVNGGTLMD